MKGMSNQTLSKLLLVVVFAGQAIGAFYLLTPAELLNREPLYTGDYPTFLYRCLVMPEFLAKSGTAGGYDPYLKAGYVFPAAMGDGSRIMQILTYPFPPAVKVLVLKWYVMAVLLLIPWLLYLAARNFDLSEQETAVLMAGGLILWWIPFFPYKLVVFGLINFVLASYLSLYVAALLYQLTITGRWRPCVWLGILMPLTVLVHILSLAFLAPVLVCAGLLGRSKKAHGRLLLCLVLTLALNGFWLAPYLQEIVPGLSRFISSAASTDESAPTITHLTETNLLKNLKTFFTGVAFPLAVMAVVGLYRLRARGGRVQFYMLSAASLLFVLFNYFGSRLPGIVLLQPIRFKLPMQLFLLIPTCIGISSLYDRATQRYKSLKPAWLLGLLCLLCLLTLLLIPIYRSPDDLSARISDEGRQLLKWLQMNTDDKARILLEGDDIAISTDIAYAKYYGGHLPMLLPQLTKREFIGTTFPVVDVPSFSDGLLFTQDIRKYSLDDFKKCFEMYNIKWIVCWSTPAVETFMSYPDYLSVIGKIDIFYIFGINRAPSYYIKGSGDVQADYSTLRLTHIRPDQGSIIIKYHWADGLRTRPERALNPVYTDLDPYGFIEILDPPESLTVHYAP